MAEPAHLVPARDAEAEIVVERSRFLAVVRRVVEEADARAVIDGLRSEHWSARHHCSAFVLGADAMVERSNDDGEPAGTAGAPMLEVIRGRAVTDVVVVVVRWFGGVLLGTGGLARAYSAATRAGLDEAGTLLRSPLRVATVSVDHGEAGRLEHELRAAGLAVLDVAYDARAHLRVGTPEAEQAALVDLVARLSGGRADCVWGGVEWTETQP